MLTIHNPPDPGWTTSAMPSRVSYGTATGTVRIVRCGCDRSHPGSTRCGSTTLMVRDVELSYEDLVAATVGCLSASGTTSRHRAGGPRPRDDATGSRPIPGRNGAAHMYHRDRQQWHYTDDDRWLHIHDDDD